jgi:hypothetical protein
MPNRNPWQARHAKRRVRKPGNLLDLQRKLWRCLCEAELILEEADDPELVLKAVHAISQCSGQYAKLLEVGEIEARVQALEAGMSRNGAYLRET